MPSVAAAADGRSTAGYNRSGRVTVGPGRTIYVECRGKGSPTVVLISGKGNGAADWHQVLDAKDPVQPWGPTRSWRARARSTTARGPCIRRSAVRRVFCSYDRPNTRNTGKDTSTPRAQPHTVDRDVDDLHRVLEQVDAPEPYVLVAHSYGGFVAELYARRYPQEVGGLVMVDAGSSSIGRAVTAEKLGVWDQMNRIAPPDLESVELADAVATLDAAPPLHRMPAVVLTADRALRADLQPPDADLSVTFTDWLAGQDLLAQELAASTSPTPAAATTSTCLTPTRERRDPRSHRRRSRREAQLTVRVHGLACSSSPTFWIPDPRGLTITFVPLYMDRHDVPGATAEEIAAAHSQDVGVQSAHGVRYLTYWFEPESGSVFCLAEGPSIEAVEQVHREAHGQIAGNVIEVEPGPIQAFFGSLPEHPVGESYSASAVRAVLFTDICGSTEMTERLGDDGAIVLLHEHDGIVRDALPCTTGER